MTTRIETIALLKGQIADLKKDIDIKKQLVEAMGKTIAWLESQPNTLAGTLSEMRDEQEELGKHMPWSSILSDLFQEHDNLTLGQVCDKVVAMGFIDEITPSKRASISNTLIRKVNQGELGKNNETGAYHRKRKVDFMAAVNALNNESKSE